MAEKEEERCSVHDVRREFPGVGKMILPIAEGDMGRTVVVLVVIADLVIANGANGVEGVRGGGDIEFVSCFDARDIKDIGTVSYLFFWVLNNY